MINAQLRSEINRADGIDLPKIKELCRNNPIGCIVDNKMRSKVWMTLLVEDQDVATLPDPSLFPSAKKEEMDAEDARVLDADVKRTRGYLPMFQGGDTQEMIRSLLTRYCLNTGMKYKQGMHELLAPFVALSDPPLSAPVVYAMFQSFITRYLGPFFRDDGMHVVQVGFQLFHILLLYHDPVLGRHLDECDFPPSLYATPWIMTLFAHNLEMYLVHRLWDTYISMDDPTLVYYLALGLLRLKRKVLLEADAGELPEIISSIRISSPEDIAELLPVALDACRRTPTSFAEDLRRTTLTTFTIPATAAAVASSNTSTIGDGKENRPNEGEAARVNIDEEALVWHAREGCHCMEVSSYELVDALLYQMQQQGPRSKSPAPPIIPGSPSNSSKGEPNDASRSGSPMPAMYLQERRTPLNHVVIDVRSHEEHSYSGGGRIARALRLEPQLVLDMYGLENWLAMHDVHTGLHLCIIGSKIRRKGRGGEVHGGDKLWRRLLFGEGDGVSAGLEQDGEIVGGQLRVDHNTGDTLIRVLRSLGYPMVSKLKGSFDNLIDYLFITRNGRLNPIVENHDSVLYEKWRRGQSRMSKLPASLFTCSGLQTPMVPSSSSADRIQEDVLRYKSPVAKRYSSQGIASLERALKVAERNNHGIAAKVIQERLESQGQLDKGGRTSKEEEEDDVISIEDLTIERGAADSGGRRSPGGGMFNKAAKLIDRTDGWTKPMAQQGATLQNYNNELVKCIEDLREKREEINRTIAKEEEEKAKIQKDLSVLTDKLSKINEGLARKVQARNEYDKTIQETESAYMKILESSQTLLHVLKREQVNLTKKKQT